MAIRYNKLNLHQRRDITVFIRSWYTSIHYDTVFFMHDEEAVTIPLYEKPAKYDESSFAKLCGIEIKVSGNRKSAKIDLEVEL